MQYTSAHLRPIIFVLKAHIVLSLHTICSGNEDLNRFVCVEGLQCLGVGFGEVMVIDNCDVMY